MHRCDWYHGPAAVAGVAAFMATEMAALKADRTKKREAAAAAGNVVLFKIRYEVIIWVHLQRLKKRANAPRKPRAWRRRWRERASRVSLILGIGNLNAAAMQVARESGRINLKELVSSEPGGRMRRTTTSKMTTVM